MVVEWRGRRPYSRFARPFTLSQRRWLMRSWTDHQSQENVLNDGITSNQDDTALDHEQPDATGCAGTTLTVHIVFRDALHAYAFERLLKRITRDDLIALTFCEPDITTLLAALGDARRPLKHVRNLYIDPLEHDRPQHEDNQDIPWKKSRSH